MINFILHLIISIDYFNLLIYLIYLILLFNHSSQESCPGWKDAKSIVALLRQCNYNIEDCVSTYHSINDDGE